jgi:hypothetical protein
VWRCGNTYTLQLIANARTRMNNNAIPMHHLQSSLGPELPLKGFKGGRCSKGWGADPPGNMPMRPCSKDFPIQIGLLGSLRNPGRCLIHLETEHMQASAPAAPRCGKCSGLHVLLVCMGHPRRPRGGRRLTSEALLSNIVESPPPFSSLPGRGRKGLWQAQHASRRLATGSECLARGRIPCGAFELPKWCKSTDWLSGTQSTATTRRIRGRGPKRGRCRGRAIGESPHLFDEGPRRTCLACPSTCFGRFPNSRCQNPRFRARGSLAAKPAFPVSWPVSTQILT